MRFLVTLIIVFHSLIISSQEDKLIFAKEIPIKLKSQSSYSFLIGYEVKENSDIALDFSGGPQKFWAGKTIPVTKGKGIITFQINSKNKPKIGTDYKVIVAIRKSGGDWKTNKLALVIKNIEVTKEELRVLDDASFSPLTPVKQASKDVFSFEINYIASQERKISVAIYNQNQWIGASKNINVVKGKGTKKVQVRVKSPPEGKKYKYVLYYGSGDGFPDKNITSKEISGVTFTAPQKTLSLHELREKSIILSLNKTSNILTLPGALVYNSIQIITPNGEIIKEVKNTNSIEITDLQKGAYFVVTGKNEYYQFVKI